MKKSFIIAAALSLFAIGSSWACTNFLAGKNATVDGSTLISYAADSYSLYGVLYRYPAAVHAPGTMRPIYEWDTGKYLGEIPEAERTYSVIGNMNEHQLAIGETTWGGRPELVDTTGLIDYGSLIYIALQRCKTAREAIQLMTSLVAEYGYYSSGESFSIADPNEVWIMELVGKGPGNKGAVWVAARIPDDCVSGHANQARITQINFEDKENWMYSPDVVSFARKKGYFKGKDKDFSFSDTYNPMDFSSLWVCEARVWSFFRQVNAEMDKYITYIKGETKERMPLWIKPDKKVSAQDFKNYMRDQYEGTELDITQGIGAGPFNSKMRHTPLSFELDGDTYWFARPTATQQTGFSFVAQLRSWLPNPVGGVLWFGVDDAATNLYVPMYCGITEVPLCFKEGNGSMVQYSSTSAFWTYNAVANFAYSRYGDMLKDIRKQQKAWEDYFNVLVPAMDKAVEGMDETAAREMLTRFSCEQAEQSTAAWKKLGEYLLVKYMDGVIKKEADGKFVTNEAGIVEGIIRPGYPEDYLRMIAPTEKKEVKLAK